MLSLFARTLCPAAVQLLQGNHGDAEVPWNGAALPLR